MFCPACQTQEHEVLYEGPIRIGKPGNFSKMSHQVLQCKGCELAALVKSQSINYESDEYRKLVNGTADSSNYYKLHDKEILDKLAVVGTEIRGKTILDIGCGAGSFLDAVKALSKKTIAIEPTAGFHPVLNQKGHEVYSYTHDYLKSEHVKVDLITCFAVIEHVEDPLKLLRDAHSALTENGLLIVSTPNLDDWLLEFFPETYRPFFYRLVHNWYFNRCSLGHMLNAAGFTKIDYVYQHRYDLSNLLFWLKEGKPTGNGKYKLLEVLDGSYQRLLEKEGRAEFLFALARK